MSFAPLVVEEPLDERHVPVRLSVLHKKPRLMIGYMETRYVGDFLEWRTTFLSSRDLA